MAAARTAVVTGASRGIGLELARRLAADGYQVLVTSRDAEAGRAAAAQLPGAWSAVLDVRDEQAHEAVVGEAASRGPLEVWVNNAGVLLGKPAWEHSADEVRTIVETNLLGTVAGSLAAVRHFGDRQGSVLNVASVAGLGAAPAFSVYAATKAAIVSFSVSLQGDLRRAGRPTRVHALCPDAVSTSMITGLAQDPHAAVLFSGRHLTPEAVAEAGMALLGSRAVVRTVPRIKGGLMRAGAVVPSAGLVAFERFHAHGLRRQRR
jgi:short-subunit dehydrogenase